jgi:hypothetical protein
LMAGTLGLLGIAICSMTLPTLTRAPASGRLTLSPRRVTCASQVALRARFPFSSRPLATKRLVVGALTPLPGPVRRLPRTPADSPSTAPRQWGGRSPPAAG